MTKAFVDSIKPPTMSLAPLPVGAKTLFDSTLINMKQGNAMLNNLNKIGGFRNKKRNTRGGADMGKIVIAEPQVLYKEIGSGTNTITSINKSITQNLMNAKASAEYDPNALRKGGSSGFFDSFFKSCGCTKKRKTNRLKQSKRKTKGKKTRKT